MTADLVAFLRARLDEDEAVARAATAGPWTVDTETYPEAIDAADGRTSVVAGGRWGGEASVFESTEDAVHIARWNPARVLAEVDAKRRIIEQHHRSGVTCPRCSLGTEDGEVVFERDPCQTLRLLALPYADHPDYEPEWAPHVEVRRAVWRPGYEPEWAPIDGT